MSNVNVVCFNCRIAKRVDASNNKYSDKCHKCGALLENIGYQMRVPKTTEVKKWKEIRSKIREEKISLIDNISKEKVRRESELCKEIETLELREENRERRRLINKMKSDIEKLKDLNSY